MSGSYDDSASAAEETTDSFWEVSPDHPLHPQTPLPLHPRVSPGLGAALPSLPESIPAVVALCLSWLCQRSQSWLFQSDRGVGGMHEQPQPKAPSLHPQISWC